MFGEKATKGDNYYVIRNGVDTDKFAFPRKAQTNQKRTRLRRKICCGQCFAFPYPENHSLLIDVFAEIKKVDDSAALLLVGDGGLRAEIEEKRKLSVLQTA